jgi:hypothetical protein
MAFGSNILCEAVATETQADSASREVQPKPRENLDPFSELNSHRIFFLKGNRPVLVTGGGWSPWLAQEPLKSTYLVEGVSFLQI